MSQLTEVQGFIRSTFRSVWSLELLIFLRRSKDRAWATDELVTGLRASQSIIGQSVDTLTAAGLVATEGEGNVRYLPASADLDKRAEEAEAFYARSPDAVRRLIVMAASDGLSAFADAFRLRKD
jgi:DNA-binding transcriptional ArsR family regulator